MHDSSNARATARVALVIGNSDYDYVPDLPNAKIDAQRIKDELTRLGFDIIYRPNATKEDMLGAATEFIARLDHVQLPPIDAADATSSDGNSTQATTEIGLIYYAGHGVEFNGQNYAVPVDFDRGFDDDDEQLSNVQQLMYETSSRVQNCIVILDACRDTGNLKDEIVDTTTERTHQKLVAGLTKMKLKPESATFVAFAADPGDPAYDGPRGEGSAFTRAISKYIGVRGLGLHDALQYVAKDVREESDFKQRPWSYSNLTDELCLVPKSLQPMWCLAFAGLIAGLINGLIAYSWSNGHAHNVRFDTMGGKLSEPHPETMLAALLFGLVLGYANWKWGNRTLWAAVLTVLVYAAIAASTRYWIAAYAANESVLNSFIGIASWDDLRTNLEVKESILVVILGGAVVGAASVISGALSAPALRSFSRVATGAFLGACAAGLYVLFLTWQSPTATSQLTSNLFKIWAMTSFWQAALAANIGHAYATFVPRPK